MQVGFGLSPFQSGLVTFSSAVGAMGMKTLAARIIRTFGFRNMMTVNAVVSSVFLAACALFTVTTPLMLIFIILVVGGFFRSLQFTAINTVAYAEVEPAQMSRATTLVSVNQQLAISAGVAVGAFSVESTMLYQHVTELNADVFPPAFLVVAVISAVSAYFFWQMPDDAGHEISGRKAVEISSRKGAEKAATKAASEGPGTRGISGWVERIRTPLPWSTGGLVAATTCAPLSRGVRVKYEKHCSLQSPKIRFPDRPGSGRRPTPCR